MLGDLAVRIDVSEKCRRIEVARIHLFAAGDQRGARRHGALDHPVDLVALLLADQRTGVGALFGGVAVLHHSEVVLQLLDDLVVVLARYQNPGRDRTALTGMAGSGECGEKRRHVEVAVVEHDRRRLPTQFEEDAFTCLAGGRHDRPTRGSGAGEGDHVHVGARRQGDTDFRVYAGEHVDHTGRNVGVVGDQLAERKRDQRRVRCALQHNGASGSERRREFGQRQLRRVVVRDDRRHHPRGFFLHPAVVLHAVALAVAEILGQRVCLQQISVVSHDRDRCVELGARAHRGRRTDFGDGQLGELVAMVDQGLMQLLQAADPQLGVGGPVGGVERTPRRGHRGLGVGHCRVGSVTDHLFGGGINRRKRPGSLDQPPVDQHAPIGGPLGCVPSRSSTLPSFRLPQE